MKDGTTTRVPALRLDGVSKAFGPVVALRSGSLTMHRGSIHALIGENGAGKSTLVKIVAGLYRRDSGEVELDGRPLDFTSTAQSKAEGIAVIYQEPTLFPDLSVTENIFMGRQPTDRFGRVDRRSMRREATAIFERLGVALDPDRIVEGLSIADQQLIEIAKAISLDSQVLIMDEPTAALSGIEVERLFAVARSLRDEGRALLFISHRFEEVFELCDTVTVMRDGSYIDTLAIKDTTVEQLVALMVGRDVTEMFPKLPSRVGDVALEVQGLTRKGVFRDISFSIRSGEIVGLAGLVGAGRSEVARAIFGVDRYESGSVRLHGKPLPAGSPRVSTARGIALVPEDRRKQGLVLDDSVARTNQNAWIEMMKEELEANHPEIELVEVVYGDDDDQTSFDRTAALLQTYPELKGIISPTTVGIAAAARYLSTSQYKGQVALAGLGTPNQMREYVEDGTVTSFALWNPGDLGYLAADASAALINGEITGEEGDTFEAGSLGEYEVGPDSVVLLGDPFVFDADNIGDFDF